MVQRSTSVIESVPTPNPQKPPESRAPCAAEVPEDGSQPDQGRRAARLFQMLGAQVCSPVPVFTTSESLRIGELK